MSSGDVAPDERERSERFDDFEIHIVKKDGENLGLDITYEWNYSALMVKGIKDGAIARWNAENPRKAVKGGDMIVKLNGKYGDAKAMLKHISRGTKEFRLTILRWDVEAQVEEWSRMATIQGATATGRKFALFVKRYSILVLKAGAGTVRLLLEDLLNILVQAAFLVKYWNQFEFGMRLFTMASMGAGLICSCLGPVKDLVGSCKVSRQAAGAGYSGIGQLTIGGGSQQPEEDQPRQSLLEDSAAAPEAANNLYAGSVLDFITEGRAEHSVAAHRVLIVNSLLYWGSMALVPVLFWEGIKGGVNAVVPKSAVLFFVLVTMFSIMVELWIVAHTKRGFDMLIYCGENFWKAITCKGYKEAVANGAIALSILGRWDTFSDVVFATILCKTDVITELDFSNTLHKTIALPIPLHQISLFSVIVGVFCFQGIPGILLMITKKGLPAAFKLNEFNFLLGVVELEAEEDIVEI